MESHKENEMMHMKGELTDDCELNMHVGKPEAGMGFTQVFIKEEVLHFDGEYPKQLHPLSLGDKKITTITEPDMDIKMERHDKNCGNSIPSVSSMQPTVIERNFSRDENPHFYNCAYCGYHFSTEFDLQVHLRIHSSVIPDFDGEYPKQIDPLSLEDKKITTITEHDMDIKMERHDKNRGNSIPSVSSMQPTVIECNLPTDENSQLYNCAYCGYHFSTEFDLQVHLRIHSSVIPCDEAYSYESWGIKSNKREIGKLI